MQGGLSMTKLGTFFYDVTNRASLWLMKHKILYYILACTWGCIMTIIGCLVSLVLMLFKKKPKRYKGIWYFNVGKAWGGVELGLCFLTDSYDSKHTKDHETGHTFQNALYGPFFLLIAAASAARYWQRVFLEHMYNKHKSDPESKWCKRYLNLPDYDAIWFEGSATYIGEHYNPSK